VNVSPDIFSNAPWNNDLGITSNIRVNKPLVRLCLVKAVAYIAA